AGTAEASSLLRVAPNRIELVELALQRDVGARVALADAIDDVGEVGRRLRGVVEHALAPVVDHLRGALELGRVVGLDDLLGILEREAGLAPSPRVLQERERALAPQVEQEVAVPALHERADLVERGPHAVASEVDHPALDHLLRARGVRRAQGLVEEERVLARREQAPEALLRLARELVQGPAGLDE